MLDPETSRRLKAVLEQSGYVEAAEIPVEEPSVHIRRIGTSAQLRILLALFMAGEPVLLAAAESALGTELLQVLQGAGLLSIADGDISSAYRVSISDGLLLVYDPLPPTKPDYVTGVNGAARTLANLTLRRRVGSALDIGTGCGYQALLAAHHAQRVVATDILGRAISLTTLNARLNSLTNVECRQGSFFEPIGNDRFDLIVCNPPFIISPDSDYAFRDSGLGGDAVSQMIVGEVARHLNEGGFATVLVNWGLAPEQQWDEPGKRWLADSQCDAVLVRYATLDRLAYAATWNSHLLTLDPGQYRASLERWPSYLEELAFESVTEVGVILRRREGENWIASLEASAGPSGAAGEQLERIFNAHDWLQVHEHGLLDKHVGLIDGHHLHQAMRFAGGSYDIQNATMQPTPGLGVAGEIPADLVPLLFALPQGTVREVVTELAQELDREAATLLREAEAALRALLERGLLVILD